MFLKISIADLRKQDKCHHHKSDKCKDQFIYCRRLYKQVILIAFSWSLLSTYYELKGKWITESPKLKMDLYMYFPRQLPAIGYLIIPHPTFIAIDATEHYLKTTNQYYHNLLKFCLWLLAFENTSWSPAFIVAFFFPSLFSPWKFHGKFQGTIP